MEEKVALVQGAKREFGVSAPARMLGLSRSTWYYRTTQRKSYEEKYEHLQEPLEAIARKHSGYGYRRTTPELRETHGHLVNHKVVQQLHQLWALSLLRGIRPPKPSGVRKAIEAAGNRVNLLLPFREEEIRPFQVLYTDFTELIYRNGGAKAWLIPLLGHRTKMAFGWAVGERANTVLALEAWRDAKRGLRRWGMSVEDVIVHHDQDPVFTGYGWTDQLLIKDHVRVSYALRGARDNPEMESFFGRLKVENHSIFLDAQTPEELRAVVAERMQYYNRERRHSTLGNRAPETFTRSLTLEG